MGQDHSGQLPEQGREAGAVMVFHAVYLTNVREADLVLDLIRHSAARCADHQMHQLQRLKAGGVLHVGTASYLGGQHGFGLIKGPVAGNVECLSHGGTVC